MLSKNKGFFPFSPSFMEEMDMESTEEEDRKPSAAAKAVQPSGKKPSNNPPKPPKPPKATADKRAKVEEVDPKDLAVVELVPKLRYLVGISQSTVLHFAGFGKVTLLGGSLLINGYAVKVNEPVSFNNPSWQPTLRAFIPQTPLLQEQAAQLVCPEAPGPVLSRLKQLCRCVFIVEGCVREEQEWLVAVEGQEAFAASSSSAAGARHQVMDMQRLEFTSGTMGLADSYISQQDMQLSHLPASWTANTSKLVALCAEHSQMVKVMVCGAKGVGKSTLAKYIMNRLVSEVAGEVFYLNCDLGQPEFSGPGCLSLHRVSGPLLSASHFHIKPAEVEFFIGDLTTRHEPELVLQALQQVMACYQHKVAVQGEGKSHLVVNTDGFIRYMGAEILNAIFNTVQPTHVLHINNHKNPHMPFSFDKGNDFAYDYQPVEEGRTVPSRVKAVDLRHLRLASYFLRHHPLLAPPGQMSDVILTSTAFINNTPIVKRKDLLDDISIRSANLVGGESGALALAMLTIAPIILPLDKVVFNVMLTSPDLPPSMLLAAANMNLVGLSVVDKAESEPLLRAVHLSADGISPSCCIQYLAAVVLKPSVGVALVRAVDIQNQHLVITTPIPLVTLLADKLILVSISGTVRLPNAMITGAAFPTYPYLTSELAGEGAAPLRTRPNKKRRGLHQNGG